MLGAKKAFAMATLQHYIFGGLGALWLLVELFYALLYGLIQLMKIVQIHSG